MIQCIDTAKGYVKYIERSYSNTGICLCGMKRYHQLFNGKLRASGHLGH